MKKGLSTRSAGIHAGKVVKDMIHGVNKDLFALMIRHFLLSMITICSTQMFTGAEIAVEAGITKASQTDEFDLYYGAYICYHVFRTVDSIVSTLYILLSFKANLKYYDKVCGCCQNQCIVCWGRMSHSRIRSRTMSDTTRV